MAVHADMDETQKLMAGKLILHIGTHKTATTSIQRFLRMHDRELQKRGVYYPDYTLIGKRSHYAHFGIVNGFSGEHQTFSPEDAREFFRRVSDISRDHDVTILSAESFYRHGWPKGSFTPEQYWRSRNDYIARVRDMLGEAQVVVVFRAQAEFSESLYQENVKVTGLKEKFSDFLQARWPHFSYLEQAKAWNASFPGLKVLSYHKLIETGDAVKEFGRLLSIPIEDLPAAERHNESLPHDLVALKRWTNGATSVHKKVMQRQFAELKDIMAGRSRTPLERRSFFADEEARHIFQDTHTLANEALRPFMLHHFDPQEPVFPGSFRPVDRFGDDPTPEFLLELIRTAISRDAEARRPLEPSTAIVETGVHAGSLLGASRGRGVPKPAGLRVDRPKSGKGPSIKRRRPSTMESSTAYVGRLGALRALSKSFRRFVRRFKSRR